MISRGEPRLIEIFAGTSWEAGFIKSLLENAGIEAYLKDEIRGVSTLLISASATGGVKVLISSDNYKEAKEVMEDYYKNTEGNS